MTHHDGGCVTSRGGGFCGKGASKERTKRIVRARAVGDGGDEGDEKRATVVRGYRELHNSWPSHNGAAQGCERADGMSFSFVSSRGDYFSFHSFVSCRSSSPFLLLRRPPSSHLPFFSLSLFFSLTHLLSLSAFLALILFSPSRVYARANPSLFVSRPFLSLTRPSLVRRNRHHKVIILRMRERKGNDARTGQNTSDLSLFLSSSLF